MFTLFCTVGDCRIHVRVSEHIGHDLRHGHRNVVEPDSPFSRCACIQYGTLEVRIALVVQLAIVLDKSCDCFVCIQRTEFEIGDIALEEVAKVFRYPQAFAASHTHRHTVACLSCKDTSYLALQLDAISDRVEARVEEDISARQAGKHAQACDIDELAREEEEIDADASLDGFFRYTAVERVLGYEELAFLVGTLYFCFVAMLQCARAGRW